MLERLEEALGIDKGALSDAEEPEQLHYSEETFLTTRLPPHPKCTVDDFHQLLLDLRAEYADALTLQFLLGKLPVLDVDRHYSRAVLNQFYKIIAGSSVLAFELRIRKATLLKDGGYEHPAVEFRLFLFADALQRVLSEPLTALEDGLLSASTGQKKMIVLVPDAKVELDGPVLAILGGTAVTQWRNHLPAASSLADVAAGVTRIRAHILDKPRWAQFDLDHLTPLQLQAGPPPAADDAISGALYAQLLSCSLLYLASHAIWQEGEKRWIATFSSDATASKVEVGMPQKVRAALVAASSSTPGYAAATLGTLTNWVYEPESRPGDRLIILQSVIAGVLAEGGELAGCGDVARQSGEIALRTNLGWNAFVGGQLEKYLSQVKALEAAVQSAAEGYDAQVQSLTKALIDNMLAAVAVVVGSFIAAMFKSPFQAFVFWFGTGVYLTYLLFFPIGVGLIAAWKRFQDSKALFRARTEAFERRLTPGNVDKIVGKTIAKRESGFYGWFALTVVLYTVVLGVMASAAWFMPGAIRRWSDDFTLSNAYLGTPVGEAIRMTIRGENFDKDKEIVVTIGHSRLSNTDGETVKVHGSTVLTVLVPKGELARAVTVQQGNAPPKTIAVTRPRSP